MSFQMKQNASVFFEQMPLDDIDMKCLYKYLNDKKNIQLVNSIDIMNDTVGFKLEFNKCNYCSLFSLLALHSLSIEITLRHLFLPIIDHEHLRVWKHVHTLLSKKEKVIPKQGSTLRKIFISPAGLVTVTFTSPEIFLLALILMTNLFK